MASGSGTDKQGGHARGHSGMPSRRRLGACIGANLGAAIRVDGRLSFSGVNMPGGVLKAVTGRYIWIGINAVIP